MKCTNDTVCNFGGVGVFEEFINGNYIRLNKVYYS